MNGVEYVRRAADEGRAVGEVAGQDELCLHERQEHDADEDDGDRLKHDAEVSEPERHGQEGDDGGEHAEGDGRSQAARALDGGLQRRQALLSHGVHLLGGDDGVVHDDPEHEDEAEDGGEIDRQSEQRHEREGAKEGHEHAYGDPEDGVEPEKEADADEDEDEAAAGVLQQQADAALHDLRAVAHELEFDAVREALVFFEDVFFDLLGDVDGVLGAFTHDGDVNAALAIDARDHRVLVEAVGDGGDLTESELGAVRTGEDDDAGVVGAAVGAAAGADGDVSGFGLDDASGQVDGAAADGGADLIKGEAEFTQAGFRDLDADLVVAHAAEVRVGDAGQGGELVPDLLSEAAQVALRHVGGEDDADDGAHEVVMLNHGPLGQGGEVRDGIHADFHVVDDLTGQVGIVDFERDIAAAGGCGGDDALDSGDLLDGVLDAQDDGFFHLLRSGSRVGDADGDEAGGRVREDLGRDALGDERPCAEAHDGDHEKIGGDAVTGKPGDHGGRAGKKGRGLRAERGAVKARADRRRGTPRAPARRHEITAGKANGCMTSRLRLRS